MKRFYLTNEQFNKTYIDGDEFNHIKNVMRMTEGDEFIAFIGNETDYVCSITNIKKDYLLFDVIGERINNKNPRIQLDIFQALSKGDKMELVAQKTTEIGISGFYSLYIKNCDVKQNSNKPQRLEKIVIGACKQCGRSKIPYISEVINLKECIELLKNYDLVLFANETEQNLRIYDTLQQHTNAKSIAIIIGPEGGFTHEEISELATISTSVSLGKRILRTETAGIYLASIVSDFYRN